MMFIAKRLKLLFLRVFHGSLFSYRFLDNYYVFHQKALRGSLTDISKRLSIYLPYIKKVKASLRSEYSFLDCGFGRGEFMRLIHANKLTQVTGVDTNPEFVSDLQKLGFNVIRQDMITHLYLSDQKYCGISAFHVIEHLRFEDMFDFFVLAHEKLAEGGVLILETPNIENIIVSSTSFCYDHTHVQKVPREVLAQLLGYIGFSKNHLPASSSTQTQTQRRR